MISTTRLAQNHYLTANALFRLFDALELVKRDGNKWVLTDKGSNAGGDYNSSDTGKYIVWPEKLSVNKFKQTLQNKLISATDIGKHFNTTAQKINKIIAELGWVEQQIRGWQITKQGESIGGYEFESSSGSIYIKWKIDVLDETGLKNWFKPEEEKEQEATESFEKKVKLNKLTDYPTKYKTQDGHFVRSLSEGKIDDWLYVNGIVHAYEKTIIMKDGKKLKPDWYIPPNAMPNSHKVYIEFWGRPKDKKIY